MAATSAASSASSPAGAPSCSPSSSVLSFRDGLMLGERFHYDLASLVRQIGCRSDPCRSRRWTIGTPQLPEVTVKITGN